MISGTFRRYAIYSVRALAATGTVLVFVFCVFSGFEGADFVSSFFAPEVAHLPSQSPFYRSIQIYYKTQETFNSNNFEATNVAEWYDFFESKVNSADVHSLLYADNDTRYIDTLIFYTKNNDYPVSDAWRKNSINNYPDKSKKLEFLYYLGFAKRCEPYVTKPTTPQESWGEPDTPDAKSVAARKKLLSEAPKFENSFKIPFVRQRYHFQIVRLLFMDQDYTGCIRYYQDQRNEIETAGTKVIKCRTWSYVATAMHRLKQHVNANYLFSRIFDEMPDMQKTAMFYFEPVEESDWQACLAMAKTPHERDVLWEMTGIKHTDELRAMKEIYKTEPSSDVLDLLLVRLVNEKEDVYLYQKYKQQTSDWESLRDTGLVVAPASDFIKNTVYDTRLHNRPLWYLCGGYILQMQGKYTEAKTWYDKASELAPRDTLLNMQAHLLRIVANAELTTKLDAGKENEILADLKWLEVKRDSAMRQDAAYKAVRSIISSLYAKEGKPVMAELASGFSPPFYFTDSNIYKIIALLDKPGKTPMEQYLTSKYDRNRYQMFFFLGLEDIYRDDLDAAKKNWTGYESPMDEKMDADPFLIHIRDCHDCDHDAVQKVKYTRMEFLDRMIALKKKARESKKDAADAYFQMANGFYNITYSGNNRMFYVNNISVRDYYSYPYSEDPSSLTSPFDSAIMNTYLAEKYYLMARDASSDKEFKAKCTFMAAKCDDNGMAQENARSQGNNIVYRTWDFGTYYKELKEKYSQTAYEKEVIKECSYFRYYLDLWK